MVGRGGGDHLEKEKVGHSGSPLLLSIHAQNYMMLSSEHLIYMCIKVCLKLSISYLQLLK